MTDNAAGKVDIDSWSWSPWRIAALAAAVLLGLLAHHFIEQPIPARAAGIIVFCLVLWLSEAVPVFAPTLALFVLTPALLGPLDPAYHLKHVMLWAGEPVLILFFGGFTLGVAAAWHGIDHVIAQAALRAARGRPTLLIPMLAAATAFLSMWMLNTAAAALMIAAIGPLLRHQDTNLRAALLLAVAFGANLGGMATPIGTGPNAIAIAAMPESTAPGFLEWMAFALPLTVLTLAGACVFILLRHPVSGQLPLHEPAPKPESTSKTPRLIAALAAATILAWLSEPLHGVPAPVVSLALTAVLFGTGLLPARALRLLDWSTLIVIAGGIALGRLVEHTGLFTHFATQLAALEAHPFVITGLLVTMTAFMSALMSNTATATLLIPLAMSIEPGRTELPILIAIAASFGMPFVISTPPNAMVVGAGLRPRELLWPGLILMLGGCILITLTGRQALHFLGL